ncbi:MAG TPA: helix-turn-helix domain-containing protein [Kofleriaceae bacterium]|nr:helix-turn-helix domain-containing protein [Kofleriaceae bacterium]
MTSMAASATLTANMAGSRLTPKELEARRVRAIRALTAGKSQSEVAAHVGASRASVSKWVDRYRDDGVEGLLARRRGRPRVRQAEGAPGEVVLADLLAHRPGSLGLPGTLWTQQNISSLMSQRLGSEVSRWTVARYCADWELRAPQPLASLELVDAATARRWFTSEYRALKARFRRSNASILFYERTQVNRDPRETAVQWLIGGRGDWSFLAYPSEIDERALIDFFTSALQHFASPIAVIALDAPLLRGERLRQWLQRSDGRATLELVRP